MLNHENILSLDTPSSVEHLLNLAQGFLWGGIWQTNKKKVAVSSPYFLLTHIFMSCFVSVFLWDRLSQAGNPACGEAELVWWRPGAGPQAYWTLRAVWILPAGCSSHCVIGRIMFRDSLFFCTSICSAWAARCILVSWKWSGVNKRSGPPPHHCSSSADEPIVSPQQRDVGPQRAEFIHCPGVLLWSHQCNSNSSIRAGNNSFLCEFIQPYCKNTICENTTNTKRTLIFCNIGCVSELRIKQCCLRGECELWSKSVGSYWAPVLDVPHS